jgi:hypothetical protein
MRILGKSGGWVSCLTLAVFLALPALEAQAGLAGYPGSFFFGDAQDCDGFIQGTIIGLAIDYSGCRPPSSHIQDVAGDGFVAANDVTVLKSWVIGLYGNPSSAGVPFGITLLTPATAPVINAGDTVPISAWAGDNIAHGPVTPRTGWGMIFEIDPASSCPNLELDGRDPTPAIDDPRDKYITSNSVFEYTSEMDALPQGGAAEVLARYTGGCAAGTTIDIIVRIPDDDEAIPAGQGNLGRFRNPEVPASPVQAAERIRVPVGASGVTVIAIDQPDPLDLDEGDTVRITATCTYDDFSTDDCSNAGGLICSVTGDLTEAGCIVTADQIPCGAGGTGTVTVEPNTNPNMATDVNAVNVNNDDIVESTLISPDSVEVIEGTTLKFNLTRAWSDTCTEDLSSGAGWQIDGTGDCTNSSIGAAGLFIAGMYPGPADPACTDQISTTSPAAGPADVTVRDMGPTSVTAITIDNPDPIDLTEGDTVRVTATCTYDDFSTDDCSNGGGISCSVAGDLTEAGCIVAADQIPCGAGGTGSVTVEPNTNPNMVSDANAVNVNNDDTIISTSISPDPGEVQEQNTLKFDLTRAWSDTCTEDLSSGAGWQIDGIGDCTNSSIGPDGLFTAGAYPGSDDPACTDQISTTSPAAGPVDVTVRDTGVIIIVTAIAIDNPDPINLMEGDTVRITATCTYDDLSTDDCSGGGGGITCSVTGDVTVANCLVTADQIPGGGGSGTVTVEPNENPNLVSDTHNVNVLTNDYVISIEIDPDSPRPLLEGETLLFTCTALWSDSTYED